MQRVLGRGGFGIVYLVTSRHDGNVYALKTFLHETGDKKTLDRFRQEADIWITLGSHPFVVQAHFIDEIGGRFFVAMEYITPPDHGHNSLESYLKKELVDYSQILRWAIQLCYGMEYVVSRGIRSHRDLKPANLMINEHNHIKITDFGLATRPHGYGVGVPGKRDVSEQIKGFFGQTMRGIGFGTPTHMPPEQFEDVAGCDVRSDIYSTGVILYQMVTEGGVPVMVPWPHEDTLETRLQFWKDMESAHRNLVLPHLDTPLAPIIQRCMAVERGHRYPSWEALRNDLAGLLYQHTGEVIRMPGVRDMSAAEWVNKGLSLQNLNRYELAVRNYDQALARDPRLASAWNNKGICFAHMNRFEEAVTCYERAASLDPQDARTLNNQGNCLRSLGRFDDALSYYEKALKIDPGITVAWSNRANIFFQMGRHKDALAQYERALKLDPRRTGSWYNKGQVLKHLHRYDEALLCFDEALKLNSKFVSAIRSKGDCYSYLRYYEDALYSYDTVARLDKEHPASQNNRGVIYARTGHPYKALSCFCEALKLDSTLSAALYNKGNMLHIFHRFSEASAHYDRALSINPKDASAWHNHGMMAHHLRRYREAVGYYDRALGRALEDTETLNNKAVCLFYLSRERESLQYLDQAINAEAKNAFYYYNRGIIQYLSSWFGDALASFNMGLGVAPNYDELWRNKGVTLLRMGHTSEALRCLGKAYDLSLHHQRYWSDVKAGGSTSGMMDYKRMYIDDMLSLDAGDSMARFQDQSLINRSGILLRPFALIKKPEVLV